MLSSTLGAGNPKFVANTDRCDGLSESIRIAFTDFWHDHSEGSIRDHNPIFQMLPRHFLLSLSRQPDFLVYSWFGYRFLGHLCPRIFCTGENIHPDFDQCDYAFSFDFPAEERNYRLPLYRFYTHFDRLLEPRNHGLKYSQRGFCNFVSSNAAARERIEFFELLHRYRKVDSGGGLLNNVGGRVEDKLAFQSRHRFSIALENSSHPGYTSEKLIDALNAGTVPNYWGNPDAAMDFNPACMINCHEFESFEAVVHHVIAVDRDEALFRPYLEAPVFVDNEVPEFLREERIMSRFRQIFAGSARSSSPGPSIRCSAS